jgi:hypothetical protein
LYRHKPTRISSPEYDGNDTSVERVI